MDREDLELEQIKASIAALTAQTQLALEQGQTEFWKVGIASLVAGAVIGGLVVQILNTGP